MRVVSENSAQDIAKRRADDELRWSLRELAANMMRVVRGTGKPHEIGSQIFGLTEAFQAYKNVAGTWPSSDLIGEALELAYRFEHLPDRADRDPFYRAEHEVMRASLQVAASRLMRQSTQETRGRSDMHDAMRPIERIRAENLRKMGKPPSKRSLDRERAELRAMMKRGKGARTDES